MKGPWKKWTAEEDAMLRVLPTDEALAKMPGRNRGQLKARLVQLREPVRRRCRACGAAFPVSGSQDKTCAACRAAGWRPDLKEGLCEVCGERFFGRGERACSPLCRGRLPEVRDSSKDPGVRARLRAAFRENEEAFWEAFHSNPKTAKGEPNHAAKGWRLVSPAGERLAVRNLRHFCRSRPDLFGHSEREQFLAAKGLGKLRPDRGDRRAEWNGWTWDEEVGDD